jgi:uncharacterized protein YpbB
MSRVIRRKHSPFEVGVFSLQKYFKIISKSLQKVVDKLKKMCYIIVNERGTPQRKGAIKMYETVKTVNGYEIKRMKGTHGFYTVTFWKSESGKDFCT